MLTHLPPSDLTREDIHEQAHIDEVGLLEPDVGNIAHPDLIAPRHLKVFEAIHPRVHTFNGSRRLTDTFDRYREGSPLSSSEPRGDTQRRIPYAPVVL